MAKLLKIGSSVTEIEGIEIGTKEEIEAGIAEAKPVTVSENEIGGVGVKTAKSIIVGEDVFNIPGGSAVEVSIEEPEEGTPEAKSITVDDVTYKLGGGSSPEVVAIDAGIFSGGDALVSPWKQYSKDLDTEQSAAIDAALVAGNKIKFTGTFSDESGSGGIFEDDPVSFEITTDLSGKTAQETSIICRAVGFIAWQSGMIHLYLYKADTASSYVIRANVIKLVE